MPARCSPGGWCAASRTAPRPTGSSAGSRPSGSGRSTRWSISPITSPTTAAGRCMSMTPTSSRARSAPGWGARARNFSRSTARPTRSTRICASSPTMRAVLGLGGVIGGEDTGVHRGHHQRVHRVRPISIPKRTAPHRPQARHSVRRALQVRARRRSGLRGAGARACHRRSCSPSAAATPSKITVAGKPPKPNRPFKFDLGLVERLSGLELWQRRHQAAAWRRSASRSTARASRSRRRPPSWRPDITGPADLVEEVVRLTGVDQRAGDAHERASAGVAQPVLTEAQKRQQARAARARRRAGWSRR